MVSNSSRIFAAIVLQIYDDHKNNWSFKNTFDIFTQSNVL